MLKLAQLCSTLFNFAQHCSNLLNIVQFFSTFPQHFATFFLKLCYKNCQLCWTLFNFIQLYSTLFNFVSLCSTLFNFIQHCAAMHKFCACFLSKAYFPRLIVDNYYFLCFDYRIFTENFWAKSQDTRKPGIISRSDDRNNLFPHL